MFCKWCGADMKAEDACCGRCGKEKQKLSDCGGFFDLLREPQQTTQSSQTTQPPQVPQPGAVPPQPGVAAGYRPPVTKVPSHKKPGKLIMPILLVVLLAGIFVVYAVMNGKVQDLEQEKRELQEQLCSQDGAQTDLGTAPTQIPGTTAQTNETATEPPITTEGTETTETTQTTEPAEEAAGVLYLSMDAEFVITYDKDGKVIKAEGVNDAAQNVLATKTLRKNPVEGTACADAVKRLIEAVDADDLKVILIKQTEGEEDLTEVQKAAEDAAPKKCGVIAVQADENGDLPFEIIEKIFKQAQDIEDEDAEITVNKKVIGGKYVVTYIDEEREEHKYTVDATTGRVVETK